MCTAIPEAMDFTSFINGPEEALTKGSDNGNKRRESILNKIVDPESYSALIRGYKTRNGDKGEGGSTSTSNVKTRERKRTASGESSGTEGSLVKGGVEGVTKWWKRVTKK